jgi:anti-sigma factor RsiW
MNRYLKSCADRRQSISLLAAGVLPQTEQAGLEDHLAVCADCRRHYEELKALTGSLADAAGAFADLQLAPAAQSRWTRAIRAASRPQTAPAGARLGWWREVVWPWRRAWTTLAAAWVVILAGNVSLHPPSPLVARISPARSQEMVTSFRDQRTILADLLADRSAPPAAPDADRPKSILPRPRTENVRMLTA